MSRRLYAVLGVMMAVLASCLPVLAGPVTFYFEGEITRVHDPNNLLDGKVADGAAFSGQFTFEVTTPDSDPEPRRGEYEDAVLSVVGDVGGVSFTSRLNGSGSIEVDNGHGGISDFLSYLAPITMSGLGLELGMAFVDSSGTALGGDQIPTVPPTLHWFDSNVFALGDPTETLSISVTGAVTVFVPEPTVLALLAAGVSSCLTIRTGKGAGRRASTGRANSDQVVEREW